MTEIFHESIRVINFPLTLLFGFSLLYWAAIIFGLLDFEFLDFDFDFDADHSGMLGKLSHYLHFGDVPTMVIFSIMFTFMWGFSMISNHYFNDADSYLVGLALLIPNFILSVTLTGIAVIPAHVFFKKLNDEDTVRKDVIGEICEVSTSQVDHLSGQAEVKTEAAPVLINARTADESQSLKKGEKAVIVRKNENGTYIIKSLEN